MKSTLTIAIICVLYVCHAQALVVNEILSNPIGDDSGREWIELYNDTTEAIDLASMTVSIKGGNAVVTTPLQGGLSLSPGGYAIIGSTVSGATKFLQDYPSYLGPLFRSSISLVNTGTTSIDIKISGITMASVPSYVAAKEGTTLSFVGGSYVAGIPTPGGENQVTEASTSNNETTHATTTDTQVTLPQMSPPSADIIIYMPSEKVVVAGAESSFSVFSMSRAGKPIGDLRYVWAFGDGGQSTGSSTEYRYAYSGRYIAQVEATSATISGMGRMVVRVVPPDISINATGAGKYGSYVDIDNPNEYELDLSQWILSIDGGGFYFPKNTILPASGSTRFSGLAMGFASTTISTSTVVKILFPNLEEVTRYVPPEKQVEYVSIATSTQVSTSIPVPKIATVTSTTLKKVVMAQPKTVLGTSTKNTSISQPVRKQTSSTTTIRQKDTRIVSWLRALFN